MEQTLYQKWVVISRSALANTKGNKSEMICKRA